MTQKMQVVMVIDDDQTHLYTTRELLKNDHVEVVTHVGSFGATNLVKGIKPDLVLLDINMPALAGNNLADLIQPFCSEMNIPILFYSSNDEDSMKDLVTAKGVHGYICKGDPLALRTTVYNLLNSQP
jgi:CheY-like chemotaxis protein